MTWLIWSKDYEVGVSQIDAEHHRLFELINELHECYLRGEGRQEMPGMLNQLIDYAQALFQHEEKLMSENNYPYLDRHRELHRDLFASTSKITERFAADPVKASGAALQFAKNWLHHHILQEDMDIADFLRRKAEQANEMPQELSGEDVKDNAFQGSGDKAGTVNAG